EDIDLNLEDFVARVNSDLVGKYINIASRCAGFISKRFEGKLAQGIKVDNIGSYAEEIARLYEQREYGAALRLIMKIADGINQFVDQEKPWELAKDESRQAELHYVCSLAIESFRLLTLYLKPVLPKLARDVEAFLGIAPLQWTDAATLLPEGHRINAY